MRSYGCTPCSFLSELKFVLFHVADEQGQLIDQHGQPADAVAHRHDLQIDLEHQHQHSGGGHAEAHVEHTAVQGDLQIAEAAETALDAVGHAGHQVEEGGAPQELDAQVDDGGVIHEEGDDGAGEEQADGHQAETVDELDAQAAEKALTHPLLFAGTVVLSHQGGHSVGDVLLGHIGEVVHPAGGGESGHCVDAQSVDDGLHGDLAQLDGGLLHGAGPAVLDGAAQQRTVKDEPAPPQLKDGNSELDIDDAEHTAERLAEDGGEGAAFAAPAQHLDKEEVAADVQHRAYHQKVKGALAVAQRPHGGGEEVVKEGEDEACKDDAEVLHRDGQDFFRNLHQPEQRRRQQDAEGRKDQREHRACDGGGGDLTLHALGVSGTIGRADEDAGTEAETVDEEDGQRHQRVGGADGGKGVFADKFAHDDAVGGVISELEQVAQHQRDGEFDQKGRDGSGRHVFCHGSLLFFFL